MDALHDALIQTGKQVQNKTGIPNGARCVDIKYWRDEFYARKDGEPEAKQKVFSRAKSGLRDKVYVAYRDNLVWNIDRTAWSRTDTDNTGH